MVVPEFSSANTFSVDSQNPYLNLPNPERPPDTAVNIQHGQLPQQDFTNRTRSPSSSPMDSSPPSEIDYAERVAASNNRMKVETFDPTTDYSSTHMPHNSHAYNKAAPIDSNQPAPSTLPVPPSAIPYETNMPADPNLWDGHFGPISLFGTNEFLQSDAYNVSCSLIRMAEFIRQRNITNRDGNKIPQIDSFREAVFNFIMAIYKAGWDKLFTSDKNTLRQKIRTQFSDLTPRDQNTGKRNTVEKIPPPISKRLPHKQVEEVRKRLEQKKSKEKNLTKSYAQVSSLANDILKLRDAFPALPNKKIIEIHNTILNTTQPKGKKKISITTKGPSRKQTIVPLLGKHILSIMNNAGLHVNSINGLLKGIKSTLRAEFIRSAIESIIITTNNVPATSDLLVIERYVKSIEGIGLNEVAAPQLPQSKSYLKITGIPYMQPSGLAITSEDITNYLKNSDLFKGTTLAAKPHVIKVSPKSDMAIIWVDIWDSQNGSKAKMLINHSFNFGRYIATFRGTSMNPGIPQCHNCWKWGHTTFSCKAHSSKCQKCGGSHKIENHRDFAWCCKANFKLNPPCLETKQGEPCPHTFKCVNCKGDHMADNTKCPFWRYCFNREWHSKKVQEAREIRANSIHLAADGTINL